MDKSGLAGMQTVLDAIPTNIAVLDPAGRILLVNRAWRAFGLANGGTGSEVGADYLASVPVEAVELREGLLDVLAGGRTPFTFDYTCDSTDRRRWFKMIATPLDSQAGCLVNHIEITHTKEAEEQAKASAGLFQELFDQTPDPVTLSEFPSGRVVLANQAWTTLTGVPREEAVGRNPAELGVWLDPGARGALFAELQATGVCTGSRVDLRSRAGEVRRLLLSCTLVNLQGSLKVLMTGKDITAQLAAVDALRESEDRFRVMAEQSPVALFLHREGRFVYLNPAAVALFRAGGPADLVGEPVLDRVCSGDRCGAEDRILKALETGDLAPATEERLTRLDGTSVDVAINARAVDFEGLRTMLVFAQDITPLRRAQEAEALARKADSLVLMAGSIAHDFNNLFAALSAGLDIIDLQASDRPEVLLATATTRGVLKRAIALSWKMNDFSGRGISRMVRLELPELLRRWAPASGARHGGRVPHLELEGVPPINGDPARLEGALDAIVANAWEAMDEAGLAGGQVRARLFMDHQEGAPGPGAPGVWASERPKGPWTVCLEIANDGTWPNPEVLSRMFDPFFTTRFVGRGLGLASVLGVLQSHGAGIHILPGPQDGLAFRIHFPVA
ncbi:PAS domain-containing sensor histidine kinase [Geothrix sp. 21YS21S-2]|uniref:hybrid sensor histidine kinase/response regulator n=1 Tax=Geothrix sp. 21YS21S-2 TaxID=3068893 RepID=UPI0027BA09F0|nr:PAS domain-containing sensor histidine kinase [Geothrix sp. 21YS21S-2]